MSRPLYPSPQGKSPRHSLDRRLGGSHTISFVVSRYTDWAIPALREWRNIKQITFCNSGTSSFWSIINFSRQQIWGLCFPFTGVESYALPRPEGKRCNSPERSAVSSQHSASIASPRSPTTSCTARICSFCDLGHPVAETHCNCKKQVATHIDSRTTRHC